MQQPDLKRLRGEVRRLFALPENSDWSPLDLFAFAAATAAAVWVHVKVDRGLTTTGLGEHLLVLGVVFIATGAIVYGLRHLPGLTIRFLRRFWWIVLLAIVALIAWLSLRAPF